MHNLASNFLHFLAITKSVFQPTLNNDGNLRFYSRKPKMTDCEVIALFLTAESIGIDSENHLFNKLNNDYSADFPHLIHRCNFNRRRKILSSFIHEVNVRLAAKMNEFEDTYIVDSIPLPVCKIVREKSSKICRENFVSAPDKGYSAVNKAWYFGYKLHLVTSVKGVFQSMDISKASVHDIHYLKDINCSQLSDCTLIADKGYLSEQYQADLFNTSQIALKTPLRSNQNKIAKSKFKYSKSRKRIETLFSQLCDQFMLKRNYAKSFAGLSVRIITKMAAVTCLQFFNMKNNKPLNHLKTALAFK